MTLTIYLQSFSRTCAKLMSTSTSLTRYRVSNEVFRDSFQMGNLHSIFLCKRNLGCHVKFSQPNGKGWVLKAGKSNRPNATRSLIDKEEDKLFKTGQFGAFSPEALQRAMWWFLSLHFGFRARDESRKLRWGDVELQQDPVQDGRELLVWINERGTKTPKGQENGHQRAFHPKIYAASTKRCPIKFYKVFRDHRPEEMNQPDSPFFLAVRTRQSSQKQRNMIHEGTTRKKSNRKIP